MQRKHFLGQTRITRSPFDPDKPSNAFSARTSLALRLAQPTQGLVDMGARKRARKQETRPVAVATTPYRLRISWVLLILLLLLALVAIALPGHGQVAARTDANVVVPRMIRFHGTLAGPGGSGKWGGCRLRDHSLIQIFQALSRPRGWQETS